MKKIIIIAGPNGSGKSTLVGQLKLDCSFINADMYEKKFSQNKSKKDKEQFATIAVAKEIKAQLKQGNSFAFETVFSSYEIPRFLSQAKSDGYTIVLHYVSTGDYKINIRRVAKRVLEGGHNVPTNKIISRYKKSNEILKDLLFFVDEAIVYDNSDIIRPFLIKENNQIKAIDIIPNWINLTE